MSSRFVAKEHHFQDGKLYITCIATISDVYQARVNDAAVGILGNITEQTNQIVIGASPSKKIFNTLKLILSIIVLPIMPFLNFSMIFFTF